MDLNPETNEFMHVYWNNIYDLNIIYESKTRI